MSRRRIFRKQQLKFMVLNLVAFTIIFSIFGIIIFSQVQNTLFSKTDEELIGFKNKMLAENLFWETKPHPPNKEFERNGAPKEKQRPNPRIIVLHWNKDGEIVNQGEIGTLLYENYLLDFKLDEKVLDTITNITINEQYHFRYLLFEDSNDNDDIAYTQLLMNTDAEQTIIHNFGKLIMICSLIFIILSISASYILSKKMMQPIIAAWNKQAEFVENASHELRTPLTVIQNKLELLLRTPQEKIADKFESIALSLSETRRLSKLTSNLLTLARADSAETQLVLESFQFDDFVQKVSEPYIEIAESQDKHFWLSLNSKININADKERLHQLLVILLDNALKYTNEHDSIGVKTYIEDLKIVVEVTDTGIGIKEENLQNIFERFYREDKARSRETGGVGLGLSIAQWIVEKHHGTISVLKNQQKGTTFIVKFPK
ncbi:sensor histidine kinase [Schinkia azotoformans]|nr:HAMP domain-containing sensor histidine kinase [Schinkia azotoformans]MEC1696534.1 HAMP domain-containing sensor histidine kinase [Schinkia azotoformans]MEC1725975.1 HAMP domain-containing sensor histidine kinase [Schinkia azotoformans]MEC1770078.1 HAMP domain-containing sensor histidine kinase [Schinkia azotoformans]MEC1778778.1 HAMP domain-containing sensor histidine kinase [Schinkia azotoformans]MED4330678.1 HAMP domain-containing sensor histidine kinase [Schinkia azotoformans]